MYVYMYLYIYIYTYLSQKWPIREGTERRKKWKHPTLEAARPGGAPMASCCHWFHCWLLYHSGSAWTKFPNNPSTDWLKNSGIMDSMNAPATCKFPCLDPMTYQRPTIGPSLALQNLITSTANASGTLPEISWGPNLQAHSGLSMFQHQTSLQLTDLEQLTDYQNPKDVSMGIFTPVASCCKLKQDF